MKWYDVAVAALWLLAAVVTGTIYNRLPARVPTHWNAQGQVDGWSSPGTAALIGLGLPVFVYVLMWLSPRLDPRGANYQRFAGAFRIMRAAVTALLILAYLGILDSALGHHINMSVVAPLGVGLLFMVIGNLMGQVRPNYFIGIRTPWTLASDEVWRKTHRFGARAFLTGGLLMALSAALSGPVAAAVVILVVLGLAIGVPAYSYWVWRRMGA